MKNSNISIPTAILVGLCILFGATQARGSDLSKEYVKCQAAVKVLYPNAIIKLHKAKRNTIELLVINNGRTILSCDRKTSEIKS